MGSDLNRDVEGLLKAHGVSEREVYLDSENSGLIFPEALKAMVDSYEEAARGHPAITHKLGWESYEKLYESTLKIAQALNCNSEEITYTHNGTEANNLAILGLAEASKSRRKILVSSIEHLSVIFAAEHLQKFGFKVVKVPVDGEGFVDLDFISRNVDKDTLLVSVALVNHEIGTIQDVKAIIDVVKGHDEKIVVHTDACDALGRVKLDLKRLNLDLASFSSHKIYGPKGVGALYIKEGVNVSPIIYGQLSTQHLWPSLENIPAIVGFSKAVELMHLNFESYNSRITRLRDKLIDGLLDIEYTVLNGPKGYKRSPDNVNISFLFCEGEALTVELSLKGIYVSSGSACTSRILEPSHVLQAIGRRHEEAHGSILMKITPFHSDEDVDYVIGSFPDAIRRIRSMSPMKPGGG
ncbi:cysteine desulfurase [Candidatus Bathyarchaeota archaeon]|nr:cysteine desulfurase [Candidatus Bathyarchaeota archaeon]